MLSCFVAVIPLPEDMLHVKIGIMKNKPNYRCQGPSESRLVRRKTKWKKTYHLHVSAKAGFTTKISAVSVLRYWFLCRLNISYPAMVLVNLVLVNIPCWQCICQCIFTVYPVCPDFLSITGNLQSTWRLPWVGTEAQWERSYFKHYG